MISGLAKIIPIIASPDGTVSDTSHRWTSRGKRASHIGAMGEFDQHEDTFSVYFDELEHYFTENGQKQHT